MGSFCQTGWIKGIRINSIKIGANSYCVVYDCSKTNLLSSQNLFLSERLLKAEYTLTPYNRKSGGARKFAGF